jgi:hypothetical protein
MRDRADLVFLIRSTASPIFAAMPDTPNLRQASRDELRSSLSFALRYNGRRRIHSADELMADITAERLVEHLERSGYVMMCKPSPDRSGPGNLANAFPHARKLDQPTHDQPTRDPATRDQAPRDQAE